MEPKASKSLFSFQQQLSEEKEKLRLSIVEQILEIYYLKHDGHMCEFPTWPTRERVYKLILSHCQDDDIIKDTNFSQLLNLSFDEQQPPTQDTDNSRTLLEPTITTTTETTTTTTSPTTTTSINTSLIPQNLSPHNDSISPPPLKKICRESPVRQKQQDSVEHVTTAANDAIPDKTNGLEPMDVDMVDLESVQPEKDDIQSKDSAQKVVEVPDKVEPEIEDNKSAVQPAKLNDSTNKDSSQSELIEVKEIKSPEKPRPLEESPTRISKVVDRIVSTPVVNTETHQEQIYERAKHEAAIQARIAELRKQGLWSAKRLPKLQEPPRPKTHWDYLLEEMKWLSTDFDAERRWKRKAAKKCALMVYRYHQEKRSKIERAEREHVQNIKKIASAQAKEVRNFWSQIEELVDFRQTTKLEETRKKAWGLHLNYMLDQTSKMTNTCLEESTNDSTCPLETTNTTTTKEKDIDYLNSQDGDKQDVKEPVIKTEEETEHQSKQEVEDIAAGAQSIQPKGNTLETTTVSTTVPFLLKHSLREYQHIGLDWLVAMYNKKLNGILADEMGLGKTIQTIALLAHLACEKGDWGPHLIVVPTSVMLNWEMEIKKWCPAFKILTYYGNPKERKMKRVGWSRPNSFHICITSYRIVIQDHAAFRRKKWTYFILDEAHYIKNFKSQRWQMLLNFNSQRRLLLTGTPLQNDLMELWSLMHFLMPKFFDSCREFKDWFVNPLSGMVEGNQEYNEQLVARLHKVLRPFLLRRLKCDVEKQLPRKREFIKTCRLSKRQRFLYEEFMSLTKTKETLASGNFLSVINVLMQLRKVCNHPNLFEPRPTISPLMMKSIAYKVPGIVTSLVDYDPYRHVNLGSLKLLLVQHGQTLRSFDAQYVRSKVVQPKKFVELIMDSKNSDNDSIIQSESSTIEEVDPSQELIRSEKIEEAYGLVKDIRKQEKQSRLEFISNVNYTRCTRNESPYYHDLQDNLDLNRLVHLIDSERDTTSNNFSNGNGRIVCGSIDKLRQNPRLRLDHLTGCIDEAIKNPEQIVDRMTDIINRFVFCVPAASAPRISLHVSHPKPSKKIHETSLQQTFYEQLSPRFAFLNKIIINMKTSFPELRLIEYDCGKLQTLGRLLTELKSQDHRVLIFTQMSRMLDILEQFLNYHGHTYLRLDGATKIDQRQILMERFNNDRKIFCFILSTRSGGIGVNLTGADTVIFYDSDWNPTMDAQAQDRCHRIGQTKDVHIYRLISEDTIEKNIFMKAQQKRMLGDLAIEDGNFNTSSFKRNAIHDLFDVQKSAESFELDKVTEVTRPTEMTKAQLNQLEQALSKGEAEAGECVDVDAIEQARDDVNTDLREFDETIPITEENSPIVEKSEKEQEIDFAVSQMTPIQQFAVRFLESLQKPKNKEELEQAELELRIELENKKSQWEQSRIELLKDQAIQNDTNETVLTYPRGAKCERVHYMLHGEKVEDEEMPLWAPPTPPTSPPSPVEETNSQHHYQPSMTPAMAARINAMGGLANIFGFGSESNTKDVKSFIDEKDLYVDFSHHFLYEPNVMLESQLPPVNQEYTESEHTSYTIGSKKIRITGTPVVPSGYFSSQSNVTHMPHLQQHLQNLTNIPTTPDGLLNSSTIGQQAARKPKVRRDEVICLPKSIFDRQTPNFAKIRRELKLQKLRCVTKGNDSDPFAMQKFFHTFSLNPLGQSLQQDSIVTQVNRQIQQFNDSRILLGYHQEQLPPWTIQEEWALLLIIQHLQDVPVNLCILTPGHTPNWELTSEFVSDIGFTHRSNKMCEYHFAFEVQKREMTRDSSWDERAVPSYTAQASQPPPPKKAKKSKQQNTPQSQANNGNINDNQLGANHTTAGSDASQSSCKSSSMMTIQTSSTLHSTAQTIPFKPSKTGALLAGDRSLQLSFGERYEIIARIRQNRPRQNNKSRYNLNQGLRNRAPPPPCSSAGPPLTPLASHSQSQPGNLMNHDNFRLLKPEAIIAEAIDQRKRQAYARTMDPRYAPPSMNIGMN